jgi:hypothetical protein
MRKSCRWSAVLAVAVGLVVASCGGETTIAGPAASGDGLLDCHEGEVTQGAGIEVFADSEDEAVALALQQWTSTGAVLVALPADESWSAVVDGRDVAIAYPERNGDGRWTVHAVSTCGPPVTGPAPLDGSLDCANDAGWGQQGSIDPTVPGLPTPGDALLSALQPFLDKHGEKYVSIGEGTASIVVDDREQVVAVATEVDAGGWVVTSISGCQGFER